jgi:hypothetical protein
VEIVLHIRSAPSTEWQLPEEHREPGGHEREGSKV